MFRRNFIGASIATILLATAGFAAAATDITDVVKGGAEAAGGASGSYAVDASGAYDVANASFTDGRAQAIAQWDDANRLVDETRSKTQLAYACPQADVEPPALPIDGLNTVEAAHADSLTKNLDASTGLVDANADVSLWGSVRGFFNGMADAFTGLFQTQVEKPDACAIVSDMHGQAATMATIVDDARSHADGIVHTDAALPELKPSLDGDYALEHAGGLGGELDGLVQIP